MPAKKPLLQGIMALLDQCLNMLKVHPESGTGIIGSIEDGLKKIKSDIDGYRITKGDIYDPPLTTQQWNKQ